MSYGFEAADANLYQSYDTANIDNANVVRRVEGHVRERAPLPIDLFLEYVDGLVEEVKRLGESVDIAEGEIHRLESNNSDTQEENDQLQGSLDRLKTKLIADGYAGRDIDAWLYGDLKELERSFETPTSAAIIDIKQSQPPRSH